MEIEMKSCFTPGVRIRKTQFETEASHCDQVVLSFLCDCAVEFYMCLFYLPISSSGMFENGLLRRISGPKREREKSNDEVIREWRKLHKEKLHNLNTSPNGMMLLEWSNRVEYNRCRNIKLDGRGEKTIQKFGWKNGSEKIAWQT